MAGSRVQATFVEELQKLLGELGQILALPDADHEFIQGMQQAVAGRLKARAQELQAQQGQQAQMAMQNAAGQPTLAGPGAGGGYQPAGVQLQPQMPNPDELRRVLAGNA